jgi:hypothetical protein
MTDGGFDPIAVEADVGDTLAISVHRDDGATSTTYGAVPLTARPAIVRTSPPEGRTDVPLNCVIQVVFNEPMDSVSLSDALHLLLQGVDVPGSVSGVSASGVILSGQFVPTAPLAPSSVYEVFVSPGARSLGGLGLEAPVSVQFTTQSPGAPDTGAITGAIPGAIQVNVHTDGAPLDPDGYTILLDNESSGQPVPVNGQLLLTPLAPGDHRVRLEGAAGNCWLSASHGGVDDVPGGASPLPPIVRVASGGTASVTFDLLCLEPGTGAIDVRVERSGDPFSYFTTLILIRPDGLSQTIQPGVVQGLPKGSYQVWLTGGVPFHIQCSVTAPNPRTVDLGSDGVVSIVFHMSCVNE